MKAWPSLEICFRQQYPSNRLAVQSGVPSVTVHVFARWSTGCANSTSATAGTPSCSRSAVSRTRRSWGSFTAYPDSSTTRYGVGAGEEAGLGGEEGTTYGGTVRGYGVWRPSHRRRPRGRSWGGQVPVRPKIFPWVSEGAPVSVLQPHYILLRAVENTAVNNLIQGLELERKALFTVECFVTKPWAEFRLLLTLLQYKASIWIDFSGRCQFKVNPNWIGTTHLGGHQWIFYCKWTGWEWKIVQQRDVRDASVELQQGRNWLSKRVVLSSAGPDSGARLQQVDLPSIGHVLPLPRPENHRPLPSLEIASDPGPVSRRRPPSAAQPALLGLVSHVVLLGCVLLILLDIFSRLPVVVFVLVDSLALRNDTIQHDASLSERCCVWKEASVKVKCARRS